MIDVLLETNNWITEQKEKWEHYSLNMIREVYDCRTTLLLTASRTTLLFGFLSSAIRCIQQCVLFILAHCLPCKVFKRVFLWGLFCRFKQLLLRLGREKIGKQYHNEVVSLEHTCWRCIRLRGCSLGTIMLIVVNALYWVEFFRLVYYISK